MMKLNPLLLTNFELLSESHGPKIINESNAVSFQNFQNLFDGLPMPSTQNACEECLNGFFSFYNDAETQTVDQKLKMTRDFAVLKAERQLTFFPEHGCVLFAVSTFGPSLEKMMHLHLVVLDAWTFNLVLLRNHSIQFTDIASEVKSIYVGCVLTSTFVSFTEKIDTLVKHAFVNKRFKNFRNPMIVRSIIEYALSGMPEESIFESIIVSGGFSDVCIASSDQKVGTWKKKLLADVFFSSSLYIYTYFFLITNFFLLLHID